MKRRSLMNLMLIAPFARHLPAQVAAKPLTANDTLATLLNHPAFAGFAERLLPWENSSYNQDLPLSRLGELMPYHRHIHIPDILAALNAMAAQVAQGKQVFYDFYDDAAIRQDPQKAHTGLFFYRGKRGAPTAIIAPGGGFQYVGSLHEGFPIAHAIAAQGYNAVVIKYRAGSGQKATQDLTAAIDWFFANAQMLDISMANYSLWGGSAGARMVAAIGSHGTAAFGANPRPKPAAVIMLYTGHSDYSRDEPPTFIAIGSDDGIASPQVMRRRADILQQQGTPVSFNLYPNTGHGFALGTHTAAQGWVEKALVFWREN